MDGSGRALRSERSVARHEMINKDDFKQRILVLCNQGYQSSFAAANLVRIGLSNVTDNEGGHAGLAFRWPPGSAVRDLQDTGTLGAIGQLVPALRKGARINL